jgi:hypothetical protein
MSMNNVAGSYTDLGRHATALQLYEQTLALQKAKLGPDHCGTLWSMWGVAYNLVKLDRGAEALPVIDEFIRHTTSKTNAPRLLPCIMDLRLRHFEQIGDAAGCRQTGELWENLKRTDPDSCYTAARMRAVTAAVLRATDASPEAGKQVDAEADRAVDWLKQALAAGYENRSRVKQEKDFAALRDRADFVKLVKMLEDPRD